MPNNSLIVECGQRSRFISYNDIYLLDSSLYGYNASFDGEGAITSAIDYVTTDELPQLYLLEGHGEAELPATLSDQLEKENIEVQSLSLLTVDAIPEDADCLMIYAPSSDISSAERDLLTAYVKAGGSLFVVARPHAGRPARKPAWPCLGIWRPGHRGHGGGAGQRLLRLPVALPSDA